MAIRLVAIVGVFLFTPATLTAAEDMVDLTGRVVDEAGEPIAGAQVRSYLLSYPPPAGRLEAEATTGTDGTFAFQGWPPTEENSFRTILVQAEGYGLGGVTTPRRQEVGTLTIRLGPATSLSGRIAGRRGNLSKGPKSAS